MIEVRLDAVLSREGRTFYWLAKQTGISHTTLWRLKKGKALGINFQTLESICEILNCHPGDVLVMTDGNHLPKKKRTNSNSKQTGNSP